MKIKNNIFLWSLVLGLILGSCDNEDFTGASNATPSSPTISIDQPTIMAEVENDTTYTFTLTLSEAQITDIFVWVTQVGGDAEWDADFTLSTNKVEFPAYTTTASFTVTILSDDVPEETETFTLQIGDDRTGNASITPVTAEFTIDNATSDDLKIGLSWAAHLVDLSGEPISDTDAADLRLLVVDANPYTTIIGGADGGSFEEYTFTGSQPDGTYYVVADFYSAEDFGDLGFFSLDLTATFSQVGVFSEIAYNFSSALSTALTCSQNYYVIAQIDKAGTTYTVSPVGQNSDVAASLADDWTELADDGNPQTAAVTITDMGDGILQISNFGFSSAWWCGHTGATLDIQYNSDGTITFPGGDTQAPGNLTDICGFSGPMVTLQGPGSYDCDNDVISFTAEITVDAGSFGTVDYTYTR